MEPDDDIEYKKVKYDNYTKVWTQDFEDDPYTTTGYKYVKHRNTMGDVTTSGRSKPSYETARDTLNKSVQIGALKKVTSKLAVPTGGIGVENLSYEAKREAVKMLLDKLIDEMDDIMQFTCAENRLTGQVEISCELYASLHPTRVKKYYD